MAEILNDDAWLCVDCGLIVANDDDSGIEDPQAHRDAMAEYRAESGCGYLVVSGCPTGEACEFHDDEDDCRYDLDFSSVECDGCGTRLAGFRFAAVELS